MSPTYWKRKKAKRLERSMKGVAEKERKRLACYAGAPLREWKMVRRVTDEAVYRTRRVIEFWVMDCGDGRTRMEVRENGGQVRGIRTFAGAMRAMGKTM